MREHLRQLVTEPTLAQQGIATVATAAALFGATYGIYKVIPESAWPDSKPVAEAMEQPPVAPATAPQGTCTPINPAMIEGRKNRIQETLRAQMMGSAPTRIASSESLKLVWGIDTTNTKPYRQQINNTADPKEKLAIANELTTKHFGFELRAANYDKPDILHEDVTAIVKKLGKIPTKLMLAIDLNEVEIMSQKPAELRKDAAAVAVTNKDGTRDIFFTPRYADRSFSHEFGHHLQRAFEHRTCTRVNLLDDPQYTAENPPGFVYKKNHKEWEGITLRQYGAATVAEDQADMTRMLINVQPEYCDDLARSDILAYKAAVIAMHADTLAKNSGTYLMNRMLAQCSVPVAPQGLPAK